MRKAVALVAVFTLLAAPLYAQSRNASPATIGHTRTNITNMGVTGLDVSGNPGYIALTSPIENSVDYQPEWYLWVDETGDLCLASHLTISTYSSFPDGDWTLDNMPVCTKVGGQS